MSEGGDHHWMIDEVLDEFIQEAAAGHARLIQVRLHADGSCSVQDDGRGIPVAFHKDEGRSALEVVLCTLHYGGGKSHPVSVDQHGEGIWAVNARSAWLEATVWRDGFEWFLRTERGVPVRPTERREPSTARGTRIRFKTGSAAALDLDFDRLVRQLKELAALHGGVRFQVSDERSGRSADFRADPAP